MVHMLTSKLENLNSNFYLIAMKSLEKYQIFLSLRYSVCEVRKVTLLSQVNENRYKKIQYHVWQTIDTLYIFKILSPFPQWSQSINQDNFGSRAIKKNLQQLLKQGASSLCIRSTPGIRQTHGWLIYELSYISFRFPSFFCSAIFYIQLKK